MKKIVYICMLVFGLPLFASKANDATVLELLKTLKMEELFKRGISYQIQTMKKVGDKRIPEIFYDDFEKAVNVNDILMLLIPLYKEYYTEEECLEMIKFFKSPTGQKSISNQEALFTVSSKMGEVYGQKIAMDLYDKNPEKYKLKN